MLGTLKVIRDGLESEDHMDFLKLPISVEKNLWLEDSIKLICKVYQTLGRSSMEFCYKWIETVNYKVVYLLKKKYNKLEEAGCPKLV